MSEIWWESFLKTLEVCISEEEINRVKTNALLREPHDTDAFLREAVRQSYNVAFEPLHKALQCYYETNDGSLDLYFATEYGLFLDYLLAVIIDLRDLRWKYQKKTILPGEELQIAGVADVACHSGLMKGWEKNGLLRDRMEKGRGKCLKVFEADICQLINFYGKNAGWSPDLRRKQSGAMTRFPFHMMGSCADDMTEEEQWINFYWRELRCGTNLAALVSSYGPKMYNYDSKMWVLFVGLEQKADAVGEKAAEALIDKLMKFPFPVSRLCYIQGVLKRFSTFHKDFPGIELKNCLEVRYNLQFIVNGKIEIGSTTIDCSPHTIEAMQCKAFCLMLCVLTSYYLPGSSRRATVPTKEQLIERIEDTAWLSQMQTVLCETINDAVKKLWAGQQRKSVDPWPLVLIEEQENEQVADLLEMRDGGKGRRGDCARIFAETQKKCYDAYSNALRIGSTEKK